MVNVYLTAVLSTAQGSTHYSNIAPTSVSCSWPLQDGSYLYWIGASPIQWAMLYTGIRACPIQWVMLYIIILSLFWKHMILSVPGWIFEQCSNE